MYIKPINIAKKLFDDYENGDLTTANMLFKMHRDSIKFYLKNINEFPSVKEYDNAIDFIKHETDIAFKSDELRAILSLFPCVRIKLAVYGFYDTEVKEDVMKAISNFILGCDWPSYGDSMDINQHSIHLKREAKIMGYTILTEE